MLTIHEDCHVAERSAVFTPTRARARALVTLDDHLGCAPLRGVEAKDHIFTEGDRKTHVYQVVTGAVSLYKVLANGRRQVIRFAYGGDIIGLSLGSVELYNAQVTVATRLRCLPISVVQDMVRQDRAIAMGICEALSDELTAIRDHLVCVVQRSATERLVTFLLTLSRRNAARNGDACVVHLPMTRTDIGDFLGLTIETVSRIFSKLKATGLIEIDQGTTIRIRALNELSALADGAHR
jgi:CRP-like cAMP-binding protein